MVGQYIKGGNKNRNRRKQTEITKEVRETKRQTMVYKKLLRQNEHHKQCQNIRERVRVPRKCDQCIYT